jgi:CheY-like chemotaxis protein/DNA-binding XRE family transcriptional regulator
MKHENENHKNGEHSKDNEHQKDLDIYIGRRLREKRQKLNLTLTDLAEKLGVSHQQIQKYEQAQSRVAAITLYHLGEILGVDTSYFFQGYSAFMKKHERLTGDVIVPDRESTLNILLVEDDAADELLTRRAFNECSVNVNLFTVHDGVAALDFLRNKSTSVDFPRPDVVLLDLNIPKRDGATVLREIKRDRDISDIPVIIMTNSINFQEMISCYKAYAAGYICKPFDFDIFQSSIDALARYWAQSVVLPSRAHGMLA